MNYSKPNAVTVDVLDFKMCVNGHRIRHRHDTITVREQRGWFCRACMTQLSYRQARAYIKLERQFAETLDEFIIDEIAILRRMNSELVRVTNTELEIAISRLAALEIPFSVIADRLHVRHQRVEAWLTKQLTTNSN